MLMPMFLKGLNTLQHLVELNLADNNIEKIGMFLFVVVFFLFFLLLIFCCSAEISNFLHQGHSLNPNTSLHNLNLSGNKISSIKVRLKTQTFFYTKKKKKFSYLFLLKSLVLKKRHLQVLMKCHGSSQFGFSISSSRVWLR